MWRPRKTVPPKTVIKSLVIFSYISKAKAGGKGFASPALFFDVLTFAGCRLDIDRYRFAAAIIDKTFGRATPTGAGRPGFCRLVNHPFEHGTDDEQDSPERKYR